MRIELDKRFAKNVKGKFGKYEFEVGVLHDGPHFRPRKGARGLKGEDVKGTYAGGSVRRKSRIPSGNTIAQVSKENRKRLGFNYLSKPFDKKSDDLIKFTNNFFKFVFGRSEKKRAENTLQAVVRNPILRGDYGSNSALTQLIKGFDRKMIDTGQLFKSIVARCKVKK